MQGNIILCCLDAEPWQAILRMMLELVSGHVVKWLCCGVASIASVMCSKSWVRTVNLKKKVFFKITCRHKIWALPIASCYVVRKRLKKTQWGRTVATIVLTSNTTSGHKSPIPASSPRPSFYIEISHRRKEVKQRISGVPENEDCANFSFH